MGFNAQHINYSHEKNPTKLIAQLKILDQTEFCNNPESWKNQTIINLLLNYIAEPFITHEVFNVGLNGFDNSILLDIGENNAKNN